MPPLTDREYRALAELRHQLRRFLAFSEARAREGRLEPQQHQLLLAVRAAEQPPTITALAERLVLAHHSVVGLIDRLERKKLVARERSPLDRRQARVSLTALGRRLLERLTLAHRDELRRAAPALITALKGIPR